jgi:2-polyprenyl-6-methoxyphenol hydroxylase-like FAD-dependent oxidoreductase
VRKSQADDPSADDEDGLLLSHAQSFHEEGVRERVHWPKELINVQVAQDRGSVLARFKDGSSASGMLVVGAEGNHSRTRELLRPDIYQNVPLPVRFVGTALDITAEQVQPLRALDPQLFQGCHPDTRSYLWVSMLEVPKVNGTQGTANERYRVQINVSWPAQWPEEEVKTADAGRLAQMKQKAAHWAPVLKAAIDAIPDGHQIQEITLADWPCHEWGNRDGRVTLVGDAAHAMTMDRGEAANHGILDAYHLVGALKRAYSKEVSQKAALDAFEKEMRERTCAAVLLSCQACFDAHDWSSLNADSAILRRRAIADT